MSHDGHLVGNRHLRAPFFRDEGTGPTTSGKSQTKLPEYYDDTMFVA